MITAYLGDTRIEEISGTLSAGHSSDVAALLRAAGFREAIIPYLLAQVAHETDGLTSLQATKNNNYSGIKYSKNGTGSGASANGYAIYATPARWAADYYRVLSLNPGRPVDATSADDFLQRLYKNHYFEGTKAAYNQYAAGINARLKQLQASAGYDPSKGTTTIQYQGTAGNPTKQIPMVTPASEIAVNPSGKGSVYDLLPDLQPNKSDPMAHLPGPASAEGWWSTVPWYGKVGVGVGVGLIVLAAVKS